MEKKNLIVSFSGGETSAYMAIYLKQNKSEEYNMTFVFANTSKERRETLAFAEYINQKYKLDLNYIEAVFDKERRTGYRKVEFKDLKRNGEVFEDMIIAYGIPNKNYPHCTRELKSYPLRDFCTDLYGQNYYTAIGIRSDEIDRISSSRKEKRWIYPLVEMVYTTKPMVNKFWNDQPIRLDLKGYEGNCNKCWKKNIRKLMTIEKEERENGTVDLWWTEMEKKYGDYIPPHRKRQSEDPPKTFYREGITSEEIRERSKGSFQKSIDDSKNVNFQISLLDNWLDESNGCEESCEID